MNPNNDAYWHDQANRGRDDEWDEGGSGTAQSEYGRWAERLRGRIQRNEVRQEQARRDLRAAEHRYGEESLPHDIAREEYLAAERSWKAARNGERAYEEAATWWELARMERSCLEPGEDFSDFFWELQGVSPEEGARVAALDAAAFALVDERCGGQAGWAPYEKAKFEYCKAYALGCVAAAEKEWKAAQAGWRDAEVSNRPAQEALEAARQNSLQESEACSVESRAIDQARRRG